MTDALAPSVLVVDDEIQIRRFLRLSLEGAGYRVTEAETAELGITGVAVNRPDGVVLDLGLPDMDGADLLRRLREWSQIPVLVLSVRDREDDKIQALEAGADDYLTKPFSSRELIARLRALLRRANPPGEASIAAFGDVEIDFTSRTVRRAGAEVKLTVKEYSLLRLLVKHRGRVVTHREILRQIWGPYALDCTHYLRVQMTHLRKKLEADPQQPRHLLTELGIGYRLADG